MHFIFSMIVETNGQYLLQWEVTLKINENLWTFFYGHSAGGRPTESAVRDPGEQQSVRHLRAPVDRHGRHRQQRDPTDRRSRLSHRSGHHGPRQRLQRHHARTQRPLRRLQVPQLGRCPVQSNSPTLSFFSIARMKCIQWIFGKKTTFYLQFDLNYSMFKVMFHWNLF